MHSVFMRLWSLSCLSCAFAANVCVSGHMKGVTSQNTSQKPSRPRFWSAPFLPGSESLFSHAGQRPCCPIRCPRPLGTGCANSNRSWPCKNGRPKDGGHRLFGRMFPNEPRRFLADPLLSGDDLTWRRLEFWREQLRLAWMQESAVQRRVAMTQLVALYSAMAFSSEPKGSTDTLLRMSEHHTLQTGLKLDAFLQVLHRGRDVADLMRMCANGRCRHPFFVAERRSDKNCSQECAKLGKRAANLKWWNKHGKQWRRKSKAKRRSRKS